jgi:hypothetical protein
MNKKKAIPARNTTRLGLCASKVVLPNESASTYRALHKRYVEHFQPQNFVELDLVSIMAHSRWRLRRIVFIETLYLTREEVSRRDDVRRYVDNPNPDKSLAWTFDRVSGGTTLPMATRYEAALHRTFNLALKQFQTVRAMGNRNSDKQTQNVENSAELTPES